MGYDTRWGTMGAGAINSICEGERFYVVATQANSTMLESLDFQKFEIACQEKARRRQHSRAISKMLSQDDYCRVKRNPDEVAAQMDRLKAIGNGEVPALVKLAWKTLVKGQDGF